MNTLDASITGSARLYTELAEMPSLLSISYFSSRHRIAVELLVPGLLGKAHLHGLLTQRCHVCYCQGKRFANIA